MALIDETMEILGDLIAFPTVSSDSNLELIAYAAERLTVAGAAISIQRDEQGRKANLFATIGPESGGGIMLSGHTDVVPADGEWTSDPFEMRVEDGLIYGRGACDMKGFIAAALAMAPRYSQSNPKRPIHFAFTYDEEVGCLGGRHLVEELKRMEARPATAIIGEPTNMGIIEGHKGCYEYTTEFTGLEGHGSQPDRGVNAIEYAVRYITRLMELGDAMKARAQTDTTGSGSRFDPPWTTVQVGRIEGGTARNVIAGRCAVEWEMRPVRAADAAEIRSQLHDHCRHALLPAMRAVSAQADIVTHTIGEVAGLVPVDDNEAREIVAELTGANGAGVVAFGTEAGLFQEIGMSAVICGPGSIEQAHKPDEFVSVMQLQQCLDMLTGLTSRLQA